MPKQYRKHTQKDEGAWFAFSNPDLFVPESERAFVTNIKADEREYVISRLREAHHRIPSGHKDPISGLYLIDLLQRTNPDFLIRSKYLSRALNERQNAYWFDKISVGRLISELAEYARDEFEHRPELTPIEMFLDYRGHFFILNNYPTTWQWLWKLRQGLTAKVELIIAAENRGEFEKRVGSIWDDVDTSAPV